MCDCDYIQQHFIKESKKLNLVSWSYSKKKILHLIKGGNTSRTLVK